MKNVGIIAEYNPFHTGHGYHIAETRKKMAPSNCGIVVVMSGNWVQQGRCAIMDKWTRAKLALAGGADLVLELPTLWAISSAQGFAEGAISLLEGTGVVQGLSFGSETGDTSHLLPLVEGLSHTLYPQTLQDILKTGVSFPVARQKALEALLGIDCSLLKQPNNILALEYLCALEKGDGSIQAMTIPRRGEGFHSVVCQRKERPDYTSATDLRAKIQENQWDYVRDYLTPQGEALFREKGASSLAYVERIIVAKVNRMTVEEWSRLPDSGREEGLPYRLEKIGRQCSSVEEFLTKAKTKRYTHARLRRLLLCAYLEVEPPQGKPPYLRILGFNKVGQGILQEMKSCATLPMVTKPANIGALSPECQQLFQQEVEFTDLYGLCFQDVIPRGIEWKKSPIIDLS